MTITLQKWLARTQAKLVIIQDKDLPTARWRVFSTKGAKYHEGGTSGMKSYVPDRVANSATIWNMRFRATVCALFLLGGWSFAQGKPADKLADKLSTSEPKSITVPAAIDHNRIVINADVPLPNGSSERVHAWVDNGNPDLYISRRLATLLQLPVSCNEKECSSPPPREIVLNGMRISLAGLKEAKIPLRPVNAAAVLAAGMGVEITLPSSILRHYDVLIDFPEHKVSIGAPGTIAFRGQSAKVLVNAENGLIQIPSQLEKKKCNLALDLGSSISFLSDDVFDKLATAHADWPQMTGAVGSANMWGGDDEAKWKVMRLDRLQYGPLFLDNVAVVEFPKDRMDFFYKRSGVLTAGLLGSSALLNYRVGLDYSRSMVYFEFGRNFNFPDFDVIGLTLRPEDDGRFTILGIADFDGQPSLPEGPDGVQPGDHLIAVNGIPVGGSTMGQVWATLGGTPGQERKLTVERGGRQFIVVAKVQHFLGEPPDEGGRKKKSSADYFGAEGAANTSFSSAAVVAASRLSLTSTVSPSSSITTGPSSVVQTWRPCNWSVLESA